MWNNQRTEQWMSRPALGLHHDIDIFYQNQEKKKEKPTFEYIEISDYNLPLMPFFDVPDEFIFDNGRFVKVHIVTEEEKEKWEPYDGFSFLPNEIMDLITSFTSYCTEENDMSYMFDRFANILSIAATCKTHYKESFELLNDKYLEGIFTEMFIYGDLHNNDKFTERFIRLAVLRSKFFNIICRFISKGDTDYLGLLLDYELKNRKQDCIDKYIRSISSKRNGFKNSNVKYNGIQLHDIKLYITLMYVIYNGKYFKITPTPIQDNTPFCDSYIYLENEPYFNEHTIPIKCKTDTGDIVDLSKMWPFKLGNGSLNNKKYAIDIPGCLSKQHYNNQIGYDTKVHQKIIFKNARVIRDINHSHMFLQTAYDHYKIFIEKTEEAIENEKREKERIEHMKRLDEERIARIKREAEYMMEQMMENERRRNEMIERERRRIELLKIQEARDRLIKEGVEREKEEYRKQMIYSKLVVERVKVQHDIDPITHRRLIYLASINRIKYLFNDKNEPLIMVNEVNEAIMKEVYDFIYNKEYNPITDKYNSFKEFCLAAADGFSVK